MNIDTQALIEELAVIFGKIKDGSGGRGDLEAFASAAADLHERSVILRYKAYEQQVYANQPQEIEENEVISEEIATTEAAIESNDPDMEIPVPADPEPISMQSATEEEFDLFSLNDEEEDEEPAFVPFSDEEKEEVVEEPETFSPEADMPDFDEDDKEIANPEPVIEHPTVTAESENTASEIIEEPVYATPEFKPELPADELKPKTEENSGNHHPLYNRLHAGEDTLAARLLAVRLDTLNGAFGFNERMQIVEELFSGSNEAFNDSVHQLDNLSSKNEARSLVTKLADQYNWNDRSDLVMEFVKKVERRYA